MQGVRLPCTSMTYPAAVNSTWFDPTPHSLPFINLETLDFNKAWSARRVGSTLVAWPSTPPEWSSQRGRALDTACRRCSPAMESGCAQRFWRCTTADATTSSWSSAPRSSTYRHRRVPWWQRDWAEGMSASLRAGISALESGPAEYAVLMTVDTPDIGAAVVRRVLAAARTCAVRHRSGRVRSSDPDTLSSSRARTGRSWSPRCTVTKGRARFWLPAPMWSGWTAPTWRRAPISTSIRNGDAERLPRRSGGPPAPPPRSHRRCRRRRTSSRYPGRASPRPPLLLRSVHTRPTGSRRRHAHRADTKRRH